MEYNNLNKKNKTFNKIIIFASSLLLIVVLVYANFFVSSPQVSDSSNEIGEKCEDRNLKLYGKNDYFSLEANKDKIIIINFWATYCGPCVTEIPYFNEIKNNYFNDVYVVAIHHSGITEDVSRFIYKKYWDEYTIDFAQDEKNENEIDYYTSLGGKGTLPMTVIINKQGIITNKYLSSVNYEILQNEVEKLL